MVQIIYEQVEQNRKKILLMKLAIVVLYAVFVALIGLGQIIANNVVTLAGLMCFHRSCSPNNLLYGVNTALNRLGFHS